MRFSVGLPYFNSVSPPLGPLTCTLPEVCDAGRICTMFAAAAAADSLELGPVELLELLPLGGPRDTGWPGGPPELLLLLLCGSWDWFIWSPSEPPVPFSSTIAAFSIASCLSCHSPRPELPASFEILPAVSKRLEVEGGRGGGWWWRMREVSAELVTQPSEGGWWRPLPLHGYWSRFWKERENILCKKREKKSSRCTNANNVIFRRDFWIR